MILLGWLLLCVIVDLYSIVNPPNGGSNRGGRRR
mgnify:CR=1 FL=1